MAKQATKAKAKPPTKTEILNELAEKTELSKKDVQAVLDGLTEMIEKHVSKKEGVFQLPGLLKIRNVRKKAQKARMGQNPRTKEPIEIPAKKAHNVVRVTPLKHLKDMVAGGS